MTPWGLYEWIRIPFGLTNAPAKFQRFMEETVEDFRDEFALPYLDDVIVYSVTFKDHLNHVSCTLRQIRDRGLKLNLKKCKFFQSSVKFVGREVSEEGYKMDKESIDAALALKDMKPNNVTEIRQILGLLGYHRRSIPNFSRKAKPLTDLLIKANQVEGKGRKKEIVWTQECQEALEILIEDITTAPIMAYPDFNKPFILHTDASVKGLGCLLYQIQDGKLRSIAYGSRTLDEAEEKYHPSKLEFLAMKWAVTEKFRDYLSYSDYFEIYTDNNPLLYLMETKKLNAYTKRWISELAEFNFHIRYKPGKKHLDADCFSRMPMKYMKECILEQPKDVFCAIMAGIRASENMDESWRVCVLDTSDKILEPSEPTSISWEENRDMIKKSQREDPVLQAVIEELLTGKKIKIEEEDSDEMKTLKRTQKKLALNDEGILVRKIEKNGEQIVLPPNLRPRIYQELHVDMGHLGVDKVLALAKKRVYWPKMEDDISHFIRSVCLCLMQKKPKFNRQAQLHSVITSAPMEMIGVDYVKLEKGIGGYEYILVIVDHFTRFAQAYATKNKSTKTAADKIYNDFVLRFGIPGKIHSDQGGEFESKIIRELSTMFGVQKSRTTPYHPQGNGTCERMNGTLLAMLRTLPEKVKTRWPEYINKLIHAYNSMQHSVTGFAPFFLMFGREPRLPIDLWLEVESRNEKTSHDEFVQKMRNALSEAYRIASENTARKKETGMKRWNSGKTLAKLQIGDKVLVRNKKLNKEGPSKLVSHWEESLYLVTRLMDSNGVVYEVKKNGKGRGRVLHRNMLLHVGDDFTIPTPQDTSILRLPSKSTQNKNRRVESESTDEAEELYSDEDCYMVTRSRKKREAQVNDKGRRSYEGVSDDGENGAGTINTRMQVEVDDYISGDEDGKRSDEDSERGEGTLANSHSLGDVAAGTTDTDDRGRTDQTDHESERVPVVTEEEGTIFADIADDDSTNVLKQAEAETEQERLADKCAERVMTPQQNCNSEESALSEIVNSPHLSLSTRKRCTDMLEKRIKWRQELKEHSRKRRENFETSRADANKGSTKDTESGEGMQGYNLRSRRKQEDGPTRNGCSPEQDGKEAGEITQISQDDNVDVEVNRRVEEWRRRKDELLR